VPSYDANDTYSNVSTGTSYSSPHVGGAIALMLEKNNNATPSQIKSSLCDYAFTDIYTDDAGEEPNYQVGYGKLNTYAAFDNTLPVVLSHFIAIYVPQDVSDEHISISWTTQSEADILGFNIFRANINNIATAENTINNELINGMGSVTIPTTYEFNDYQSNVSEEHFYWLEVLNFSGIQEIHGPTLYTPGDINGDNEPEYIVETILYENFPNPAHNSTTIRYHITGAIDEQIAYVFLYNIKGQLVKTKVGENGRATLNLEGLGSGIYFYQIRYKASIITKKMIIIRQYLNPLLSLSFLDDE